jgi:hypothetical protein
VGVPLSSAMCSKFLELVDARGDSSELSVSLIHSCVISLYATSEHAPIP